VNETLAELQVQQHPDKTFIGRISRGFSFLGYEFNESGLVDVVQSTRARCAERIRQLYEQDVPSQRIGQYFRRWFI
jgi:RNA-directed DNA polymerase